MPCLAHEAQDPPYADAHALLPAQPSGDPAMAFPGERAAAFTPAGPSTPQMPWVGFGKGVEASISLGVDLDAFMGREGGAQAPAVIRAWPRSGSRGRRASEWSSHVGEDEGDGSLGQLSHVPSPCTAWGDAMPPYSRLGSQTAGDTQLCVPNPRSGSKYVPRHPHLSPLGRRGLPSSRDRIVKCRYSK